MRPLRVRPARRPGDQQVHPAGLRHPTRQGAGHRTPGHHPPLHLWPALTGTGPAGVLAATQYGPNALAVIVYLYMGQFLSKKRTAVALSELFGTPVSTGTVATATTRAAKDLDPFCDQVRAHLIAAPVVNFE
jgi:Transposase IS66 family